MSCVSTRKEDRKDDKMGSISASQTLEAKNSPGEFVKTDFWAPLTESLIQKVWWDLRICISLKFPGNADSTAGNHTSSSKGLKDG